MKNNKLMKLLALITTGMIATGCASTSSIQLSKSAPFFERKVAEPDVQIINNGHLFEVSEPVQAFFTNRQELQRWASDKGTMGIQLISSTGQIDFDQNHVAIVSPGVQPHAGYSVSLASPNLSYGNGNGMISLRVDQPAADMLYAQALSTPYAVLKIPAKPYQQIGFTYEACQLQQSASLKSF